jgi:hypothetical protein
VRVENNKKVSDMVECHLTNSDVFGGRKRGKKEEEKEKKGIKWGGKKGRKNEPTKSGAKDAQLFTLGHTRGPN